MSVVAQNGKKLVFTAAPPKEFFLSFLQSEEWAEFQKLLGRKTWRIENNTIISHDLPLGLSYLYCPRPRFKDELARQIFFNEAAAIAKAEGSIFLKVDRDADFYPGSGYRVAHSLQPRTTSILDVSGGPEDLLSHMHPKTRYNIRLAQKHGVRVFCTRDKMDDFLRLLKQTAERDEFRAHDSRHYAALLGVQSVNFANELFFAEYQGKIIASAMVNFFFPSRTAVYLHGASSREHRDVMAPHLMHWYIMQEARRRGLNYYDLWGIDENRWPGVTRFKRGFGGRKIIYPETVDVVYRNFLYKCYGVARFLRK